MSEFEELKNDEFDVNAPEEQGPAANPEPDLSPEERHTKILNKLKLRNKILRYKELFPDHLKNFEYRLEDLDEMDEKQLENLIEELGIIVNTRNASGLTKMFYFGSLQVVENTGPLLGLKINGLSKALAENQGIHDVLNEISLKYETDMYMAPEMRLGYLTATTILSLHKLNSTSIVINDFLNNKVPEKLKKEYEDL